MGSNLTPVCLYLRNSSEQQDQSIAQQDKACREYCERKGYEVVTVYKDEGKSGSDETRPGWLRLLADCRQSAWQGVVVWSTSRMGRVHPLTAAAWKDTLRKAGKFLDAVSEGLADWDTTAGLFVGMMQDGKNREYVLDLSKATIRGRVALLERGYWPNGAVPYGYDKLVVDPMGKEHLVPRAAPFRKPRGWLRYLVVNEAEATVVRRIFKQWLETDTSRRFIAMQLTAEGILPPRGKVWTKDGINDTLKNKAYAGFAHIGGVCKTLRQKLVHNRAGKHEKAGSIPALVSLEDWERANAKIAAKAEGKTATQSTKASVLSGILVCGHCGYRLRKASRADKGGGRYVYFTCESATKRPALGCKQWRLLEQDFLPMAIESLVTEVDRKVLESQAAKPDNAPPSNLDSLKRHLDRLRADIDKGSKRYLTAPDSMLADLEKTLRAWKDEAEATERQITEATLSAGAVSEFARWWDSVRGNLTTVLPIEWGHPSIRRLPILNPNQAAGRVEQDEAGQWWDVIEVEGPVAPAVMLEDAKLRGMLKDLGLKITVFWKPKTVTRKNKTWISARCYEVDRARVQAGVSHALAGHSNNYIRASIPCKD